MAENDFQYGGWNYYTLQCGTIMTMISPADCTLQCGSGIMTSEFTKWQHPAMWYVAMGWHAVEFARCQHPAIWHSVALGSWHWIRQVAAPCIVAGGSGMTCHSICTNIRHIGILYLVSILTISPQSTYIMHQSVKFYLNRTTLSRKKWCHVDFQDGGSQQSWILGVQ